MTVRLGSESGSFCNVSNLSKWGAIAWAAKNRVRQKKPFVRARGARWGRKVPSRAVLGKPLPGDRARGPIPTPPILSLSHASDRRLSTAMRGGVSNCSIRRAVFVPVGWSQGSRLLAYGVGLCSTIQIRPSLRRISRCRSSSADRACLLRSSGCRGGGRVFSGSCWGAAAVNSFCSRCHSILRYAETITSRGSGSYADVLVGFGRTGGPSTTRTFAAIPAFLRFLTMSSACASWSEPTFIHHVVSFAFVRIKPRLRASVTCAGIDMPKATRFIF